MKALTNTYQKISLLLNQTTSTTYFVAALKQKILCVPGIVEIPGIVVG